MRQKLVYYITNEERFLTPLCSFRNDILPCGGMVEGIGGEAANSFYPLSFETRVIPKGAKRSEESFEMCSLR